MERESLLAKRMKVAKQCSKIRQQLDKMIVQLDNYEFRKHKHMDGTWFADMCKKMSDARNSLGEIQPLDLKVVE